ncbi:hypothetical protein [Acidiplasma cupricumulans]|uniref:Uncharacterized protein n=1 Tax=Acidiplasma cupricumulans TaxID=312540 RepID=A0A0Q1B576_9ARCH|nr:hypothetical protein [Acidiplasma cupricumulans]KQB35167.1 hypothetical protein AOG55_07675 [Acidiplasma cupricumulans]
MRYRLAYVSIGIAIMIVDLVVSLKYPKILIYSYLGSFLGFFVPFGIGLSLLLYGAFRARDYGVNPVIGILGSGGSTRVVRQNRIQGTRMWKTDHDILSDLPGAVKSPDGKTIEYSNLFIRKPYGTTKHTRKLNEAANKYIAGELDEEGFYNYIGKHGSKEEQMLDFIKKFKNDYK